MQEVIDALRHYPATVALTIRDLAEPDLRRPEREGKWSIADVVSHLADFELIIAVRIRAMLASEHPALVPMEQEKWVANIHRGEPVAELLEQFSFVRQLNVRLLERLRDDEWSRTGEHPQAGSITLAAICERLSRHDGKHLGQLQRIITAVNDK
ncbi:MAG TPA: DinB family protein [Thermoanaerobaculia bacterium]